MSVALCFVLVRPARAENVGAAARALLTMGFADLRVVDSQAHLEPAARWVAHGSGAVLDTARAYPTLLDALVDVDFVVGTTAKPRLAMDYRVALNELPGLLSAKVGSINRVAILFGCEESGLSNQDLSQCELLSYIPLAQPQPSLNLAQAVMLYAYQLSHLQSVTPTALASDTTDAPESYAEEYRALHQRVLDTLPALDVQVTETPARWVLQRLAFANARDVRMLHFMLTKLAQALSRK